MSRSDSAQFWPYGAANQNLLAIELLIKHVRMDPNTRTLPTHIPGPTVDAEGLPLPEGDPRRAPQRFDGFVPITVDGVVAAELIKLNTGNRKLSKNNVRLLTQKIVNGEWCFNGLSCFLPCSNAALLNNQHTLQSVINAFDIAAATGKPVKPISLIPIVGLHPSVFDTFDCGKQRSTNDTLFVGAQMNAIDLLDIKETVWSQALRLIAQYLNLVQDLEPSNPFYLENPRDKLTNDRVLELFKQSPNLQESIEYCGKLGIPSTGALISLAVVGTAHAIIADVQSNAAANSFAKGLATGVNLEENSPIRQLREQVMRDKNRPGGHRMEGIEVLAMCIRTWNCIATHTEQKKRIRGFNSDGSFPTPVPAQRQRTSVTR
jgi:hypothetical protein